MFKLFILALFLLRVSLYGWAAPNEPVVAVLIPATGSQSLALQSGILAQYYADFPKKTVQSLRFYDTSSDSVTHLYSRALHEHARAVLIVGNADGTLEPARPVVPTLVLRGTIPEGNPDVWTLDDDPHPQADRIVHKLETLGMKNIAIITSAEPPYSLIGGLVQTSASTMNPAITITAVELHHGRLTDQLHAALYRSVPEQVRVSVTRGHRHHRHHHDKTVTVMRSEPRNLDGILVLVDAHTLPALAWALRRERPNIKVLAMADDWPQGALPNEWQLTGPIQGAPLHPDPVMDTLVHDRLHDAGSIRLGADAYNLLVQLMHGIAKDQDVAGHSGLLHPVGNHWWIEPYPGDAP